MTKPIFYWHIHHGILLEVATEPIKNRIAYINKYKPKHERELRLRLLKPVKGKLPVEVVEAWSACDKAQSVYNKARSACDKARSAYNKAWSACDKAWSARNKAQSVYNKAWSVRNKAQSVYNKAWSVRNKAWSAYNKAWSACDKVLLDHKEEIEALHALECPDCPWDGKTIFPKV